MGLRNPLRELSGVGRVVKSPHSRRVDKEGHVPKQLGSNVGTRTVCRAKQCADPNKLARLEMFRQDMRASSTGEQSAHLLNYLRLAQSACRVSPALPPQAGAQDLTGGATVMWYRPFSRSGRIVVMYRQLR
jgi:hypothetical protein